MAKKNDAMASVLAYEKKLVVSDGYMYGTTWENRYNQAKALNLVEKSVRGTISNRLKPAIQNDPAKLNAEVEKPNLQRIDACALDMEQDTLKVTFSVKVLSGIEKPAACNNAVFARKYADAALKYINKTGFEELARRYALNLANGRFLWRNRLGAEKLEIRITAKDKNWCFDGHSFSLRDFDGENAGLDELATIIAQTLSGKRDSLFIQVEAYALLGYGQEVYPSQELVFDKGKGEKSRVLYDVNDIAAIHSQKIGNAIRTIDTWYPGYDDDDINVGPIAIETYGAVTNLGKAFRTPKDKADFYTLFDKYVMGEELDNLEQEHYVMAVLVRGGVFGQSSKE